MNSRICYLVSSIFLWILIDGSIVAGSSKIYADGPGSSSLDEIDVSERTSSTKLREDLTEILETCDAKIHMSYCSKALLQILINNYDYNYLACLINQRITKINLEKYDINLERIVEGVLRASLCAEQSLSEQLVKEMIKKHPLLGGLSEQFSFSIYLRNNRPFSSLIDRQALKVFKETFVSIFEQKDATLFTQELHSLLDKFEKSYPQYIKIPALCSFLKNVDYRVILKFIQQKGTAYFTNETQKTPEGYLYHFAKALYESQTTTELIESFQNALSKMLPPRSISLDYEFEHIIKVISNRQTDAGDETSTFDLDL